MLCGNAVLVAVGDAEVPTTEPVVGISIIDALLLWPGGEEEEDKRVDFDDEGEVSDG